MKPGSFLFVFVITFSLCSFQCKSPTETEKKEMPADSTTQNFTFETYMFGNGGTSSYLNDAWIFDENNIWVCGNVFTYDSLDGNLMQWNGKQWKGLRLHYADTYSLFYDGSRFWLASGGTGTYENGKYTFTTKYNGGTFTRYQSVQYLWGSSDKNIWGVGLNGTIVYYNGIAWTKIDYDNQWQFYSITGSKSTGIAYALARNEQSVTIIVKLYNSTSEVIFNSSGSLPSYIGSSVVMANEKELYIGSDLIWKFNIDTKRTEVIYKPAVPTSFISCYAVSPIDIYFFGADNTSDILTHYNGKRFRAIKLPILNILHGSIRAIDNLAVAVGFTDNKASIIKIKRSQ